MEPAQEFAIRQIKRLAAEAEKLEAEALMNGIAKENIHHAIQLQRNLNTGKTRTYSHAF